MENQKVYASLVISKKMGDSVSLEGDAQLLDELRKSGFSVNELDNYTNFSNALHTHGVKIQKDDEQHLRGLYSQMFGEGGKGSELDKDKDGRITLAELDQFINPKGFTIGLLQSSEMGSSGRPSSGIKSDPAAAAKPVESISPPQSTKGIQPR